MGTEIRHHGNGRGTGEAFGYWRLGKPEKLAHRQSKGTEKHRQGTKIGLAVGTFVPFLAPVAVTVCGFVGGMVGKLAGSKIGQAIGKAARKVAEVAKPVVKKAWETVKNVGRSIVSGVKSFLSWLFD